MREVAPALAGGENRATEMWSRSETRRMTRSVYAPYDRSGIGVSTAFG